MRRAQDGRSSPGLHLMKLASLALCIAGFAAVGTFAEDQSSQSVAEAARRAREQKNHAGSTGKVWTNENVPTSGDGISVVGEAPAVPAADTAEKQPEGTAADKSKAPGAARALTPEEIAQKRADLQAQLEQARKDQERLEKELDLAKRDLDLQAQQAYSNPMALSNSSAVAAQLQPYHDTVNSKSDELEKTKAKIADLQKQLDELQRQSSSSTPQQ